ncbi:regucalcin-like [Belonocnema kinseyi]|uniref:regucalcin-like n=1 Tax=Belonocnema kinseyi TaxID=2817044 RepID=UPI00143E003D|nr:regucalcin-like [Belonocnema kinseyi]
MDIGCPTLRIGESVSGSMRSYHRNCIYPQLKEQPLEDIDVSNGLVWKLTDKTKLYIIDGMNNRIISYNYNVRQRRIVAKTDVVFDLSEWVEGLEHPLYNDHAMLGRMAIDNRGRLYVPLKGGSHVLQIQPRSNYKVQRIIRIPAVKVSTCAIGDMNMNILYVSTLACGPRDACPPNDQGGRIFAAFIVSDSFSLDAMPFVMPVGTL